jgi:hypothetical protein
MLGDRDSMKSSPQMLRFALVVDRRIGVAKGGLDSELAEERMRVIRIVEKHSGTKRQSLPLVLIACIECCRRTLQKTDLTPKLRQELGIRPGIVHPLLTPHR